MQRLLAPLLFLVGCSIPPKAPSDVHRTREGQVRTHDMESADEFAQRAAGIAVRVRGVMSLAKPDPWDLWIVGDDDRWLAREGHPGALVRWRGWMGPIRKQQEFLAIRGDQVNDYVLAHELAHWYARDWELPRVLHEGLADWVATPIAPGHTRTLMSLRATAVAMLRDGHPLVSQLTPLDYTQEEWAALPELESSVLYGYGAIIVEELGLQGVQQLDGTLRSTLRQAVSEALDAALLSHPAPAAAAPAEGL